MPLEVDSTARYQEAQALRLSSSCVSTLCAMSARPLQSARNLIYQMESICNLSLCDGNIEPDSVIDVIFGSTGFL